MRSTNAPVWLDWQTVLAEIGKNPRRARAEYRRFVEQGLEKRIASPFKEVVGGLLLGSADWVDRMRKKLLKTAADGNVPARRQLVWRPTLKDIEQAVARHFGVKSSELLEKRRHHNEARCAAIYLIRKLTSLPVSQLAARYGPVTGGAISKTVQRVELRREEQRSWN